MINLQKSLSYLFVSKVRVKCLKYFLLNLDVPIHLRAIAREVNEEINAVRRELLRLTEIKLIRAELRGNKKYFLVNQAHPYFEELSSLIYKTTGLGEELIKNVSNLGNVYFAAFTNTFVNGLKMNNQEIDVVIIGDVNLDVLDGIVSKYEEKHGKEINYTVLRLVEFNLRKKRRDPFIINLLLASKILLVGKREEYNI